jgi:hypothetical protein
MNMETKALDLSFELVVQADKKLLIPDSVIEKLSEGKWLVTLRPVMPSRSHQAFLSGYAPEDEGLYDDY